MEKPVIITSYTSQLKKMLRLNIFCLSQRCNSAKCILKSIKLIAAFVADWTLTDIYYIK